MLTTVVVGGYCLLLGRSLPPLRNEPASLLLLPLSVISGVVAFLLYPVLCHQPRRWSRLPFLYGGFFLAMVIYGLYLWWRVPDGTFRMIPLALLVGHMYGAPAFVAVALASAMLSRVLFRETG